MKPLVIVSLVTFAFAPSNARASTWQHSRGHTQIPVWPSTSPAGHPGAEAETTGVVNSPVAGRPWVFVHNVTMPTLTVYPSKGRNTYAAVIVLPGGGYKVLAMDRA